VLSVSTIEEIAEDEWDRLIDANLKGPFLMCRAASLNFAKPVEARSSTIGSVLGLVAMKNERLIVRPSGRNVADESYRCRSRPRKYSRQLHLPLNCGNALVSELFQDAGWRKSETGSPCHNSASRFGKPAEHS